MADQEHLRQLRHGVRLWNDWRTANAVGKVDLDGASLSGISLPHANLRYASLRKADLNGANLSVADLTCADLRGATLVGAHMGGVAIDGANFAGADLRKSRLTYVHAQPFSFSSDAAALAASVTLFTDSNLSESQLMYSVLRHANFVNAKLIGARLQASVFESVDMSSCNLDSAELGATTFSNVKLSGALGLDSMSHSGPSNVDLATLRNMPISARFLRGCGCSEVEVKMMQLYNMKLQPDEVTDLLYQIFDARAFKPVQMHSVFLSYAHEDATFVNVLADHLDVAGIRYWRDIHNLAAGRIEKQVDRAIRLNPIVVVVLSKNSVDSDWVEWEVSLARELEKELRRDILCPVALDDCWRDSRWSRVLEQHLKKYYILDFAAWQDRRAFSTQFTKLIRGLGLNYASSPLPNSA